MPVPEAISVAPPAIAPSSSAAIRSTSIGGRSTTSLVLHCPSSAVRFRILSLSAPTPSQTEPPVSAPPRHRMCQKAMECYGDETSDRSQR